MDRYFSLVISEAALKLAAAQKSVDDRLACALGVVSATLAVALQHLSGETTRLHLDRALEDLHLPPLPDGGDGKYGMVVASKKTFHHGEPLFLVRATDRQAPGFVQDYAHEWASQNLADPYGMDAEEHPFVKSCHAAQARVHAWQQANPNLVKAAD